MVCGFLVQCSLAFSSVRLGNPVRYPFSMALKKVACVGAPRARWCIFTSWAMVLVLLAWYLVVLISLVAMAVGLLV